MRPQKSKEILAAIITAGATILAAIIGGIFVLRSISANQLPNPTAVPTQPVFISSVTTQPSDSNSNNSGTTSINPSATSGPYGGSLVLNDPLSGNNEGYNWDMGTVANGSSCGFKDQTYDVTAAPNYLYECNTNSQKAVFSNFAYQITMKILQGNASTGASGGISFRYNQNSHTTYYLLFGPDGAYVLLAEVNHAIIEPPLTSGFAVNFNSGLGVSNLIAVRAEGSTIEVFVNQSTTPVASVVDTRISSGQIGVVAANGNQGIAEVAFTFAEVWQE